MKVAKRNNTYDFYTLEVSFNELNAIIAGLKNQTSDPICDEMVAAMEWYKQDLPGPGETKEDVNAKKEAGGEDEGSLDLDVPVEADKPDDVDSSLSPSGKNFVEPPKNLSSSAETELDLGTPPAE